MIEAGIKETISYHEVKDTQMRNHARVEIQINLIDTKS